MQEEGRIGKEGRELRGELGLYKQPVTGAWVGTFSSSQPFSLAHGPSLFKEGCYLHGLQTIFFLSILNKASTSPEFCSGESC